MQQVFDYAIDPSRRRSRSGKKIGRPRNQGRRDVEHARRAEISPRHPVHVTLRIAPGLRSLRSPHELAVIVSVLSEAKSLHGMGITDFSVQRDHLHLIVELDPTAPDAPGKDLPPEQAAKLVLARAMQGLLVRLARRLNAEVWKRKGSVFADRYHAEAKTNPTTVARAKAYVVENARKHRVWSGPSADPCSSAAWSALPTAPDFRQRSGMHQFCDPAAVPIVAPRTWLGSMGWTRAKPCPSDREGSPPPRRSASLFSLRC